LPRTLTRAGFFCRCCNACCTTFRVLASASSSCLAYSLRLSRSQARACWRRRLFSLASSWAASETARA
jgi:hypothetical protein